MSSTPHSQEDAFALPASTDGQRYYFDTYDGDRLIRDDEGFVLGSIHEAKQQAAKALPDMARDSLPDGDYRDFVVEVRDETGRKFFRARLTLVVEHDSSAFE